MNYTKFDIDRLGKGPLEQDLVSSLLDTTSIISTTRAESPNVSSRKILTEILIIDALRYVNAYYGDNYQHKDILLSLHTENNSELNAQISLFKRCCAYADETISSYKILPATDFLKINDALIKSDVTILEKQIDNQLSILTDDIWKVLNQFYNPESTTPILLRLCILLAELEDDFFGTHIHLFLKEMMVNFALNKCFTINHRSLFIAKRLITRRPNTKSIEAFVSDILKTMEESAFDKYNLITDFNMCCDKINDNLKEKLPKLYSSKMLAMLNNYLLINNSIAEKSLGVSIKTAISQLKQLEEVGFIKAERIGRELYYVNLYLLKMCREGF